MKIENILNDGMYNMLENSSVCRDYNRDLPGQELLRMFTKPNITHMITAKPKRNFLFKMEMRKIVECQNRKYTFLSTSIFCTYDHDQI